MPKRNKVNNWKGARKGKTFGENTIRYYPNCRWCGLVFGAKRPEAQTCSTRCRVALKRWIDEHGSPPLFPFGVQLVKGEKTKK